MTITPAREARGARGERRLRKELALSRYGGRIGSFFKPSFIARRAYGWAFVELCYEQKDEKAWQRVLYADLTDARDAGRISSFFAPDGVVLTREEWNRMFFVEAKDQDFYEAPPFDGQGISEHQVKCYTAMFQQYGIRTLIVAYDDGARYTAWLDVLRQGREYVTPKVRRYVWPLTAFRREERRRDD